MGSIQLERQCQSGYTGDVYIDAYKLDGTRMWRIDLGKNIRAGAHYTQFIVYDLDGDGKAEVAMKTAPGTIDGQGNYVILPGDDPNGRLSQFGRARILPGPEYLTIFNGQHRRGNGHDQLSALPGATFRLGRQLWQPRRSFPGRRGILGRSQAELD